MGPATLCPNTSTSLHNGCISLAKRDYGGSRDGDRARYILAAMSGRMKRCVYSYYRVTIQLCRYIWLTLSESSAPPIGEQCLFLLSTSISFSPDGVTPSPMSRKCSLGTNVSPWIYNCAMCITLLQIMKIFPRVDCWADMRL